MYAASLFADGNSAWKRAALQGGIKFHAGTQVLDRQWRSLKEYLPKTLATKSRTGHVNQSLWQYTYSWQYR